MTTYNKKPASLEIITNKKGDVSISIEYLTLKKQDEKGYYIQCPSLKTIGFSAVNFEEAEKDHEKDLDVFIKVHLKRKTLHSALKSLGWEEIKDNNFSNESIPSYLLPRTKVNSALITC